MSEMPTAFAFTACEQDHLIPGLLQNIHFVSEEGFGVCWRLGEDYADALFLIAHFEMKAIHMRGDLSKGTNGEAVLLTVDTIFFRFLRTFGG